MEIPLVLTLDAKGRPVYGIPVWYRILLVAILAIVIASIVTVGGGTGIGFWIIVAVLVLGALYEESWVADPEAGTLVHRSGLIIAAKPLVVRIADIEGFALDAVARGTIPGGEEERKEKAAAFAAMKGEETGDLKKGLRPHRSRAYINLLVRTADGTIYLINTTKATKAAPLRAAGMKFAEVCRKPFVGE
jgi:hypothetical protein